MNNREKALAIAKKIFEENSIIHFDQHFYLFDGAIWGLQKDERIEAIIAKEYIKTHSDPPSKSQLKEVTQYIQNFTYNEYWEKIQYLNENHVVSSINTKDGVLDLESLEVKPYTKDDFCFYKLPFNYIDNPKCPILMSFLSSSFNYDPKKMTHGDLPEYKKTMQFIQEWMGYSMIGGNKYQKALIMTGEGGNGKGVLQNIWEHIIGSYNSSHVDLKYLNDGSQIFMTRNKLVNFSKDLESNQQLDTGIVKAAVAGEKLISNEKYKGQIPMDFSAKLVVACNELPYIRNAGNAIRRRFYILPFDRIFEEHEQDRELDKKLESEAEQIFSWAVNGLKNLKARRCFDPPERCLYSTMEYLMENDQIALWIEENKIENPGSSAERKDTYKDYFYYCQQSNLKPLGKKNFYKKLEKKGFKVKTMNGFYYFEGLKLPNQILG